MELDMRMVELLTDPDRFKQYIAQNETKTKQQRKASLDYYHRNKDQLNQKRKEKYASENPNRRPRGRPKKEAAEGVVQTV